jgi:hypothetical protein
LRGQFHLCIFRRFRSKTQRSFERGNKLAGRNALTANTSHG